MTSTPDDGSEADGPSQPDPPAGTEAYSGPAGPEARDLTSLDPGLATPRWRLR